jgi:hypothetical protein
MVERTPTDTLRIRNTYCFSTTLGNVNAPQCFVCTYSTVQCVLADSGSVCTAWGTAVPMNIRVLRTDLDLSSN